MPFKDPDKARTWRREYKRKRRAAARAARDRSAGDPQGDPQGPPVTFLCVHRRATYVLRPAVKGGDKGKRAEFHDGRLTTADPEIIAALRRHPDYGARLTELRDT